ncbi:hypothetical protein [Mesorhizobium sp.]|uniref:hypothetical protein n=1 Tax=Mesorhizobium sp. TaxID=1871066 RepID=UPI0025F7321F|nr:hypothetical protein [Mesorhizobium sp.]
MTLSEAQIKYMVDRFLQWRLPENFSPDAGISFKKTFNESSQFGPMEHNPIGTNLFDATQAEAMVRNMLEGMEDAADGAAAEVALAEFKEIGGTAMEDVELELRSEERIDIRAARARVNLSLLAEVICGKRFDAIITDEVARQLEDADALIGLLAGLDRDDCYCGGTTLTHRTGCPESHLEVSRQLMAPARAGIEAQYGLNDVFPGDPYPAPAQDEIVGMVQVPRDTLITATSGDGKPYVKFVFQTLKEMQDFHSAAMWAGKQ